MADDRREGGRLPARGGQEAAALAPPRAQEPTVPAAYAEKTMHSLLRLHEELMEEKERRIDLYRRLMTREQELAELRAYVRLLEAEVAKDEGVPAAATPAGRPPAPVPPAPQTPPQTPPTAPAAAERQAPAEAPRESPRRQDAPQRGEAGPTVAWLPSNLYRTGK